MQLDARKLSFKYAKSAPWILRDVDFSIRSGERVAISGPSGGGKSTLAKLLAGYLCPDTGTITLDDAPLPMNKFCPVQLINQHPELSVNPRHRMYKILNECWTPDSDTLRYLGIESAWLSRWPGELSGGELQRFCIARALSPDTKFLICDEISTMLDVITQAQIWQLILDVVRHREIGLIVITHNKALAEQVCEKVIDSEKFRPVQ